MKGSGQNIVLLGAGRGGTTLLYKVLSLHREIGFLSNYHSRFPAWPRLAGLQRPLRERHGLKLKTWFKDDGGAYFDKGRGLLKRWVPAPNEAEQVYAHCKIPETPLVDISPDPAACSTLNRYFDAIRRFAGTQVLLTKRTANNRRIPWLEAAFGEPRYIDLVRDGRSVAASLIQVAWWRDTPLFWQGSTPRELIAAGYDELSLAAQNWVEEMVVIEAGLRDIAAARVHQVRYEVFMAEPRRVLSELLAFMGLAPDSDLGFWRAIDHLRLGPTPASWLKRWKPEERQRVEDIQRSYLERYGYLEVG